MKNYIFQVLLMICLIKNGLSHTPESCPKHEHFVYTEFENHTGKCVPNPTNECAEYSVIDGLCVQCTPDYLLTYDENGRLCNYQYTSKIIIASFMILLIVLVLYLAKLLQTSRQAPADYAKPLDDGARA